MPDSEWFQIETEDGRVVASGMASNFPNREMAIAAAREVAPSRPEETLDLVRYTRKVIRTFKKKVTIEESDPAS